MSGDVRSPLILGKQAAEWQFEFPLLKPVMDLQPVLWMNQNMKRTVQALPALPLSMKDIQTAAARLQRFAPYLVQNFPELEPSGGIIESPIREIQNMKSASEKLFKQPLNGKLLLKLDSHLPISGSIKARGGIYEVLVHAEKLAMQAGLLKSLDDYRILNSPEIREYFSRHRIEVGSTGNLGLSIGIMGASMGFQVTVHMSMDARQWKKELLRQKGVTVKEYETDYSKAVEAGRRESEDNPSSYFVDDENSQDLFLGYAVAALRLRQQFADQHITIDETHPLFVYLPCGVGGGPGGVAFGLKQVFGDAVHCFFAEPTHSPAVLIGLMTHLGEKGSVQDFGIDNRTAADGLAVGRPSGLVCRMMSPLLSGAYSVDDDTLFRLLTLLADTEGLQLEPSALAGMPGPFQISGDPGAGEWLRTRGIGSHSEQITHLVWATGGSMVPADEMAGYLERGRRLLSS
jgi:D-serine dehydratase